MLELSEKDFKAATMKMLWWVLINSLETGSNIKYEFNKEMENIN